MPVALFIRVPHCQLVIVYWGSSKLYPILMVIAYVTYHGIVIGSGGLQSTWAVILVDYGLTILMLMLDNNDDDIDHHLTSVGVRGKM